MSADWTEEQIDRATKIEAIQSLLVPSIKLCIHAYGELYAVEALHLILSKLIEAIEQKDAVDKTESI